jgi:hypothetical protein
MRRGKANQKCFFPVVVAFLPDSTECSTASSLITSASGPFISSVAALSPPTYWLLPDSSLVQKISICLGVATGEKRAELFIFSLSLSLLS